MKKNLLSKIIILLFALYFGGIGILNLSTPDRKTSYFENRELKQKPVISWKSVETGQYFKEYNDYFSDQFYKKDGLLSYYNKTKDTIKIKTEKVTKPKNEVAGRIVNDYYVRDDGWIMLSPSNSPLDKKSIDLTIQKLDTLVNEVKKKGTEVYYFNVPHKITMLTHLYPNFLSTKEDLEKRNYYYLHLNKKTMNVVDIASYFEKTVSVKDREKMYFKTDHHWNKNGANYAFDFIVDYMNKNNDKNITLKKPKKNKPICVDGEPFLGSWNRALQEMVKTKETTCYDPVPNDMKENLKVKMKWSNNSVEVPYMKVYGYEQVKDKINSAQLKKFVYANLYSNDYPELTLYNPNSTTDKSLVVLKDSYFNPLIIKASEQFRTVTVLDTRYPCNMSVREFLSQNSFDFMWIFYNNTSFTNPKAFDFDLKK